MSLAVAQTLAEQGDLYAAKAHLDALTPSMPVRLLRADIESRLQPEQAESEYRRLLGTCADAEASHGLARLLVMQGKQEDALSYFSRAVAGRPTEIRFRHDLGVQQMKMARDAEAERSLRTAYELDKSALQPAFSLMVLMLVKADRAGWGYWSSLLQPDARTRQLLADACRETLASRLQRPVNNRSVICPLMP